MKFSLRTPCLECPFRSDIRGYLTAQRAEQIASGLLDQDATFACHKTTVFSDDDDGGDLVQGPGSEHCAGALIFLEKNEQPNQLMRIAERLGMYDRTKLDMSASVFDCKDDFVRAQQ